MDYFDKDGIVLDSHNVGFLCMILDADVAIDIDIGIVFLIHLEKDFDIFEICYYYLQKVEDWYHYTVY